MNTKLNDPKFNIIAIIVVEVIACSITFTADYTGAGMASIILKWVPAIIGIATLLIYMVSRFLTKKYNWVISFIGIFFMIMSAINIYNTDFSQQTTLLAS